MRTPFIKKIKTDHNCYLYDVNTNEIVRVGKIIYDVIDDFGRFSKQEICDHLSSTYDLEKICVALEEIIRAQEDDGLFSGHRPSRLDDPYEYAEIENMINGECRQLILELTEKCNLRCRYCIYSGEHSYQRSHGMRSMDFETAKKAFNYFDKCSNKIEAPALTFYGGEPLLALDLIKRMVGYLKEKCSRSFRYNLTTNGTFLKDEIVDFFVDNDFDVLVSLDGPARVHDDMRIYANGNGTFHDIITNLKILKNKYPDYYKKKVTLKVTLYKLNEIEKIYNCFSGDDLFDGININAGFVNLLDTNPKIQESLFVYDKDAFSRVAGKFKASVTFGNSVHPFLKALFEKDILKIHNRGRGFIGDSVFPNGICCPGVRRLFCTLDGNYSVCERVNSGLFIGSVDKGIDVDAVFGVINQYKNLSAADCMDCWAVRLCSLCYTSIFSDRFDIGRKRNACDMMRSEIEDTMTMYCSVREVNDKAFDYLAGITLF
jgi:uncharacterized protein